MRIISLVPSWTETLIEAGVNVVGRTRFCIHPQAHLKSIPAIGGTKDWSWEEILRLKPDLLILDEEENPKWMSEQKEIPYFATHIKSVQDMPEALKSLSQVLQNKKLLEFSQEWQSALKTCVPDWNFKIDVPGLVEWGRKPTEPIQKIIYVIWKNPWMVVSSDTFIGSMLAQCGFKNLLPQWSEKYPKIDLESEIDKSSTLLLFSSEPYPFLKKQEGLSDLGFPYAFVNGEHWSWFGVRSLRFLQSLNQEADHYINEQGLLVFTKQYHLKRGYCCKNNCKHCPY